MVNLASFWKACGQTELPDRSVLIGQELMENAIQMRHFGWFSNTVPWARREWVAQWRHQDSEVSRRLWLGNIWAAGSAWPPECRLASILDSAMLRNQCQHQPPTQWWPQRSSCASDRQPSPLPSGLVPQFCLAMLPAHSVWKSQKSLIQHCERSELHLHFEWTKVNQKWSILASFWKSEVWSQQYYQTGQF